MDERGVALDVEPEEEPTTDDEVFYNTAMVVNRDVSVACLAAARDELADEIRVADVLAASGVRGLRYLREVDGVGAVLLNDIDERAVANIERNLELNGSPECVTVTNSDAASFLAEEFRSLDYVDIDPFGSPAPFLDATARAVTHGSAAGITATDLGPLYGSYPEVCRRRYASRPLKCAFGHEVGLRILIKEAVQAHARYDHAFTPRLAWHERHYSRVFGTVHESRKGCNRLLRDVGYLSFCRSCRWRAFDDAPAEGCPHCGADIEWAGPLWTGALADGAFADDVADELDGRGYDEARELAGTVAGEAGIATPFYDTHEVAAAADVPAPKRADLVAALREQGYRATPTHFTPQGVRTDAPIDALHAAVDR